MYIIFYIFYLVPLCFLHLIIPQDHKMTKVEAVNFLTNFPESRAVLRIVCYHLKNAGTENEERKSTFETNVQIPVTEWINMGKPFNIQRCHIEFLAAVSRSRGDFVSHAMHACVSPSKAIPVVFPAIERKEVCLCVHRTEQNIFWLITKRVWDYKTLMPSH